MNKGILSYKANLTYRRCANAHTDICEEHMFESIEALNNQRILTKGMLGVFEKFGRPRFVRTD